jgi:hypothetical protein
MAPVALITVVGDSRPAHDALVVRLVQVIPAANTNPAVGTKRKHARGRRRAAGPSY